MTRAGRLLLLAAAAALLPVLCDPATQGASPAAYLASMAGARAAKLLVHGTVVAANLGGACALLAWAGAARGRARVGLLAQAAALGALAGASVLDGIVAPALAADWIAHPRVPAAAAAADLEQLGGALTALAYAGWVLMALGIAALAAARLPRRLAGLGAVMACLPILLVAFSYPDRRIAIGLLVAAQAGSLALQASRFPAWFLRTAGTR